MRLSNATLPELGKHVRVPAYDRSALSAGIVHIGVGNFHRAHQSWYLSRIFDQGLDQDWAIIGAGVRPNDAVQRDRLLAQDCLTSLIELDPQGRSAEVVGSMIGYLPVEQDNRSLIAQMADPAIRIVSLTVTEGGYYIDPASKGFDASHPDIRHDAASPERPRTVFGAMVAALALRRARDIGPFTCLSCDNLQGNGDILRQSVTALARLSDPGLADWIDAKSRFPNSMVDCIVPATGPKQIAQAEAFGVEDTVPVTHENFRQWVIEDDFCAGRPRWEQAGVTFTDDVHDYESMKLHILNAGHQIVANAGEILSVATIDGCMAHPLIAALFQKIAREEIAPHVKPVPNMSPLDYLDLIERRFANPMIEDTTRRVAFDGSSRHTGFVHPVLREALATGAPISGLALVEAAWARMCEGTREDGSRIEPNDPLWDSLSAAAEEARTRPMAWLEQRPLYGDLAERAAFAEQFQSWLQMIWTDGLETTLKMYLEHIRSR